MHWDKGFTVMYKTPDKESMNNNIRFAVAEGDLNRIQSYLPLNYSAMNYLDKVLIYGEDKQGWTLDGYVIPRLGSGLYPAKEMFLGEIASDGADG